MFDSFKKALGLNREGASLTAEQKKEVDGLVKELLEIGKEEDFLSEHPGGAFNAQCQHRRTREIGNRLNTVGGIPLMWEVYHRVQQKSGQANADHLEYAWSGIGAWMA